MTISLCITTYNRFDLLIECFAKVKDDDRISEIVIVDDCSTDESYEKMEMVLLGIEKVKLFRNKINIGVYRNKRMSVELATNPWCIVFDSDNIIDTDYLDSLYSLQPWDNHTEYCPAYAEPDFNYSSLSQILISKENINTLWNQNQFGAFLNTMNSFWNRDEYLRAWQFPFEPISSDSIFMNYQWLAAGNKIQVVEGMRYYHRIHQGSHYVNNCAKSNVIHRQVENLLKQLS